MTDPDPASMPERGLLCAIGACAGSQYPSDREFARECADELERRKAVPEWIPAGMWPRMAHAPINANGREG